MCRLHCDYNVIRCVSYLVKVSQVQDAPVIEHGHNEHTYSMECLIQACGVPHCHSLVHSSNVRLLAVHMLYIQVIQYLHGNFSIMSLHFLIIKQAKQVHGSL